MKFFYFFLFCPNLSFCDFDSANTMSPKTTIIVMSLGVTGLVLYNFLPKLASPIFKYFNPSYWCSGPVSASQGTPIPITPLSFNEQLPMTPLSFNGHLPEQKQRIVDFIKTTADHRKTIKEDLCLFLEKKEKIKEIIDASAPGEGIKSSTYLSSKDFLEKVNDAVNQGLGVETLLQNPEEVISPQLFVEYKECILEMCRLSERLHYSDSNCHSFLEEMNTYQTFLGQMGLEMDLIKRTILEVITAFP